MERSARDGNPTSKRRRRHLIPYLVSSTQTCAAHPRHHFQRKVYASNSRGLLVDQVACTRPSGKVIICSGISGNVLVEFRSSSQSSFGVRLRGKMTLIESL